ncbi:Alpha-galactosidase [Lacticaseibacillus rhamnosus LOCK900]|nr:Alpha-galactosidase [Lacticaseibacillus rhamnosus LOCK900]
MKDLWRGLNLPSKTRSPAQKPAHKDLGRNDQSHYSSTYHPWAVSLTLQNALAVAAIYV